MDGPARLLRIVRTPETPREDTGALEALFAECGFESEPSYGLTCVDTFFDTFDGRLLAADLRLYHRAGETRWYLERAGKVTADQTGTESHLGKGAVREKAKKLLKQRRLIPFLRVRRAERLLQSEQGKDMGGLSLWWHEFAFLDPHEGKRVSGPRVFNLEGNAEAHREIVGILASRLGGSPTSEYDPYIEGLRELDIPVPGEKPPAEDRLRPDDSVATALQKILRRQGFMLQTRLRGAVLDLDPEYVHQMRVATRRARAALKLFGPVVDSPRIQALASELKWLGNSLGRVRDLDVLTRDLPSFWKRVEGFEEQKSVVSDAFETRRQAAREHAVRALGSPRFSQLFAAMSTLETDLRKRGVAPEVTVGEVGPGLVAKALARVLKWGKRPAKKLKAADLHRIRIAFKRLRYIGEFFSDFHEPEFVDSIKRVVAFQDCLGEANDAAVAEACFRELALVRCADGRPDADLLLALGGLVQVQHEKARDKRREFEKLWKRFPHEADRLKSWILSPEAD